MFGVAIIGSAIFPAVAYLVAFAKIGSSYGFAGLLVLLFCSLALLWIVQAMLLFSGPKCYAEWHDWFKSIFLFQEICVGKPDEWLAGPGPGSAYRRILASLFIAISFAGFLVGLGARKI